MVSGILLQLFYGLMGSWTAYLITSLYLEYRLRKERQKAEFRNHVIQVSTLKLELPVSYFLIIIKIIIKRRTT